MAEETKAPENEPEKKEESAPADAPAEAAVITVDAKEFEEGKIFAILSYVLSLVGIPFFLIPLIMRNNEYALYHAKQCLMLCIAGIILFTISAPLCAICIGFILLPAAGIFLLVLTIMGLINATKPELKPIPLLGKLADNWFKGIKKV